MKRILSVLVLLVSVLAVYAQTTTLTFTGRDANNHFIPLNRVVISNLTKGWQETINYPDTILVMGSVGIDDYGDVSRLELSQNVPNPFDGASDFSLCLPKDGQVVLEVFDLNGKKITSYSNALTAGCHVFRVLLSTAQSYVLKARSGNEHASIKMVNTGNAGANALNYLGEGNMRTLSVELNNAKGQSQHPFTIGDLMEYVGYANINGIEEESQRILQQQGSSQTFILQFSGTQIQLATISTDSITNITQNSATCYSHVIADGGALVTARGVCWSTSQYPTINDSHTTDGIDTGAFTSSLTDLALGTTYFIRAYAVNSEGAAYGNQLEITIGTTFDGLPCPDMPTVTDHQGNVYNTVQIGQQCWTKENMRCTTSPSTGTTILTTANHYAYSEYSYYPYSYSSKMAYYPNGDSSQVTTYGLLYNWNAAVDTFNTAYEEISTNTNYDNHNAVSVTFVGNRRGICPEGWHVPSDEEWTQLEYYVSNKSQYLCGNNSDNIAKALSSNTNWDNSTNDCAVGNDLYSNNTTDFSAVPSGSFSQNSFGSFGSRTYFMSITEFEDNCAYGRYIINNSANVNRDAFAKYNGYSVRCVKFSPAIMVPKVITNSVTGITQNSATCKGIVTDDGGTNVIDRGICYNTTGMPTISDSCVHTSGDIGEFSQLLTNLTSDSTYYVRAFAVNNVGVAYGAQRSFTTFRETGSGQSCPGMPTVTDHEGNVYNTVQIGIQCWTKENMRCTTSPNTGTNIVEAIPVGCSYSGKRAYYPEGISPDVTKYGLLYNWCAAVDTFNTVYGETSLNQDYHNAVSVIFAGNRRGICPQGWHVPSQLEWHILSSFVFYNDNPNYKCGSCSIWEPETHCIAKALASTDGWHDFYSDYESYDCTPGYSQNSNNATGFSAVPAGFLINGTSEGIGYATYFLSSSQYGEEDWGGASPHYGISYWQDEFGGSDCSKSSGLSVRCIRDDNNPIITVPTVTTLPVTDIAHTSVTCGGNITSDGGADVIARGVCWSTSPNPTVYGVEPRDGSGTGTFTSSITGLVAGATYYVRAYATNLAGTGYGDQQIFTTESYQYDSQPCPGTPTVTDHQGNIYNTVQIGEQCWTRENMRCTTSPRTGTTILETSPSSSSYTGKKAYYVDGSSSNTSTYGLLYNWNAAVDTFNTAYGETSTNSSSSNAVSVTFSGNRRGICPQGWHVPSGAEWTQLTNYVESQSNYRCNNGYFRIAKALASITGWNSYTGTSNIRECYPGYNPSSNNATGFSAVPAGHFYGYYNDFGEDAGFWLATQFQHGSGAYSHNLRYDADDVDSYVSSKHYGFSVRCLRDEAGGSTASLPTVTTSSVTDITETAAFCGGSVTADGGADVTARGVCWSTSANPTISGSHTTDGTGTGSFTSTITGLTAGTTYHVRAYATNSEGTAYGEEVSFTTQNTTPVTPVDGQPCPGAATVTDHQGNVYNTVQIGSQCWTRENMRCTTSPSTGTTILEASPTSYSFTGKKAYYVDGSSSNTSTYGLLYNWNAAVDTFNTAYGETSTNTDYNNAVNVTFSGHRRGICPQGWHVPSDAEWTQLTTYVKSQPDYVCSGCSGTDDDYNTHCIAKALASATGWTSYTGTASGSDCYPGYAPSSNNAAGFSALPAGFYHGSSFDVVGYDADFWSSTPNRSKYAYYRSFGYYSEYVDQFCLIYGRGLGFSVRCLRDNVGSSTASLPTVTTSPVTDITETTAACGGNVTADGGASVTARGVCWSTDANPTIDGSHTTDGTGTGSFTSTITGLTASTTYHVRTYATNSEGTAYGEEVSFTTQNTTPVTPVDGQPCPGAATVTDHQGNVYNTVQIGSQCWTRENMRCTTSPSTGTTILEASPTSYSFTGKKAYYVDGSSSNTSTYGLLYNWNAAVDTFNTAYGETSTNTDYNNAVNVTFSGHRRGICPQGWHVPSDAEWTQLTTYVSSQSEYVCGSNGNIAKALASTTGWNSSSNTCAVGNNPSGNNATGFSAGPAGYYLGSHGGFGDCAYFWSSTPYGIDYAYFRNLDYRHRFVELFTYNRNVGYSVRCLRD